MAGKRFSNPTASDETTTINNVKITDSEYTSDETKKTVSDQKTAETEKMMNSTSTSETTELITSPATGGIDNTPIDNTDSDVISKNVETAEVEQFKYTIKNNPNYFEEIGMNPDDLLSGFNDTGLTSSIYQEEEFTSLGTVIDDNGFSYIETEIMADENITSSNVTTSGQNISSVPPRLTNISTEFVHPMGGTWSISSGFKIRLLPGGVWAFHSGIDFGTVKKKGIICYAICDGIISDSSWHDGYGNTVYLNFTYGNKKFMSLYGHLEKSFVTTNQKVTKGESIGIVGSTGARPGKKYPIHLHFEIKDLTKKKWFNFKGSVNNTYDNRKSKIISDGSLGFFQGSSTEFSVKNKFDGYLDPAKFLNNPSDFV